MPPPGMAAAAAAAAGGGAGVVPGLVPGLPHPAGPPGPPMHGAVGGRGQGPIARGGGGIGRGRGRGEESAVHGRACQLWIGRASDIQSDASQALLVTLLPKVEAVGMHTRLIPRHALPQ